jgi:Uma2 family endonuclease
MSTFYTKAKELDESMILPPEYYPDISHIEIEDDTPVDNVFSEKQMRLLTETLYSSWKTDRPFIAMANVGLFRSIHHAPIVPDVMLSMDIAHHGSLDKKEHRTYFMWEFGKPPDVAIEIISNYKGGELTDKLEKYKFFGVKFYVVYDPHTFYGTANLYFFRLIGDTYYRIDEASPQLNSIGLRLRIWQGVYEGIEFAWLRWYTEEGDLILTGKEQSRAERERADTERERADTERERADTERERADTERKRADTERKRADMLAQKLREAGISYE